VVEEVVPADEVKSSDDELDVAGASAAFFGDFKDMEDEDAEEVEEMKVEEEEKESEEDLKLRIIGEVAAEITSLRNQFKKFSNKYKEATAARRKYNVVHNPLEWWQQKRYVYPHILLVVRGILAIPATSAPSERVFSSAGLTATDLRNRLSPDSVEDLVFMKGCLDTRGVESV
jgi:hypothetical protein